jgi:hypothetical protein
VDFEATGQLLIIYSAFIKYLRKNGNRIMQLFVDFKKAYYLVRKVFNNTLMEFGIPMKLVRLIKSHTFV